MIKIFLTISFVMCLVLVSCDASIMSSNSVVEDEDEDDLKPTCITGTYTRVEKESQTYKIVLSKVDEKYSLDFYVGNIEYTVIIIRYPEIQDKDKEFIFSANRTSYTLLFGIDKNTPTLKFGSESGLVSVALTKQP